MPRINKHMRCDNCNFYEPCRKTEGECRIEPPGAARSGNTGGRPFPMVNANDYCRVFAPTEKAQKAMAAEIKVPPKPKVIVPGGD